MPLRTNRGGGAKLDDGSSQLSKLIRSALLEGDDENPFQDIGLSARMVYRINDDASKFDLKDEIERVLSQFKGRMKIIGEGIVLKPVYSDETKEEEMHVYFEYIDLDQGVAEEFSEPMKKLGG